MLKLTYTENGFTLEHISQPLEKWVTNRVLLAIRSGTSLCVEPSSASFLLPTDLPYVGDLVQLIKTFNRDVIDINPCEGDGLEVCLEGTWLAASTNSNAGLFVCHINKVIEISLCQIWQATQLGASVISDQ
jgi:hypothetical protein